MIADTETLAIPTEGDDIIYGTDNGETILGLGGDDTLFGMGGDDTLVGGTGGTSGTGNDTLLGGEGSDTLLGEDGNDWLQGDAGNDVLIGGAGQDTFNFSFTGTTTAHTESFTEWLQENGFGDYVLNGQLEDGTTQSFFATKYTEWLESLVKEFGLGADLDGDGKVKVGLNQNDPDGTPQIEGFSAEELAAMFSDRDNVEIKTGKTSQERWYSDTWSDSSGGEIALASADGHDLVLDFQLEFDKLKFSGIEAGLTQPEFEKLFDARDVDEVGGIDLGDELHSTLFLADGSWSVTLMGHNGLTEADFFSLLTFG